MAGKIFDIRLLPMDLARVAIFPYILFHRVRYYYLQKKYILKNGAIIVSNHTSFGDPIMLASCFGYRRVQYLAGEVTMDPPLQGFLMKGLGCIKINRNEMDAKAMEQCIHVLKEGRLLAMFPEGGLQKEDSLSSIKNGASYLALMAQVPIVPVYLSRKTTWYQKRIAVIGDPIYAKTENGRKYPKKADIVHLSNQLLEQMRACKQRCDQIMTKKG